MLERLTPVLEHLVRNALAHGIEPELVRQSRGKPEIGEITLTGTSSRAMKSPSRSPMMVAASRFDKVRDQAVAHGTVGADDAVAGSRLRQFIFQAGSRRRS